MEGGGETKRNYVSETIGENVKHSIKVNKAVLK